MIVTIEGEDFIFSEKCALIWPKQKLLAVADLHFGKSTTFQSHGFWLPEKTELDDIERLRELIKEHKSEIVLFLGDFLHLSLDFAPRVIKELQQLGEDFPDTRFVVIVGAHRTQQVKKWPSALEFIDRTDGVRIGGFTFSHDVDNSKKFDSAYFTWYGHLYPVVKLAQRSELVPAFLVEEHQGCLPAFASLPRGSDVTGKEHGHIYAVTPEKVISLIAEIKSNENFKI